VGGAERKCKADERPSPPEAWGRRHRFGGGALGLIGHDSPFASCAKRSHPLPVSGKIRQTWAPFRIFPRAGFSATWPGKLGGSVAGAIVIAAIRLAATVHAADAGPDSWGDHSAKDVVALRQFVVEASRLDWKYLSTPGYEVLSRCNDRDHPMVRRRIGQVAAGAGGNGARRLCGAVGRSRHRHSV